jgi:two-component system capsular synthesis response regulator RcsB
MRILLADHHPQALWALKTILQEKPKFEIAGEATNADDLLALAVSQTADLVLVDWELPDRSIEELITDLHACSPRPIVIVMGSKPEYGRMLLNAGADAFISKSDEPEWLLEALQKYERRSKKKINT